MRRLAFLFRILANYGTSANCPYCGYSQTKCLGKKHLVLELRKCPACQLNYRWPLENTRFSQKYYQKKYKEAGYTTELPPPHLLEKFMACNFVGSPKDFSAQIGVMKALLPQGRVLDFGASWGYGVFQLRQAGYDACGFEISRHRAEYGRQHLGVEIWDDFSVVKSLPPESFDGIFASHVLEHMVSLKEVFELFRYLLKPGGIALIMVPNCGGKEAIAEGIYWGPMINEKHILALHSEFFHANLSEYGFQIATLSEPYDPLQVAQSVASNSKMDTSGVELMVIAKRAAVTPTTNANPK